MAHANPSLGGGAGRPSDEPASHAVSGLFHRRESVERAVERLAEKSVPADDVSVYVVDEGGNPGRRITIHEQPGTFRGALIGAAAGAVLGALIVVLTVLDVFGPARVDPFGVLSVLGAFRTIAASAAAGIPIGAVIGMGRWQGRKSLSVRDLRGAGVLVVVESRAMAEVAREALRESGAERVSG